MNVKELIEELEKLPQDLEVRIVDENSVDEENLWIDKVEVSHTGESGYESFGEVRLIGV